VVTCSTDRFTLGGTITGLSGTGLVLETAGGGRYEATTNGAFQFPIAVPSGTAYRVEATSPPANPSQTCAIANAAGVVADQSIDNIAVTCTTDRFTIGGRVTGLEGTGLTLRLNGRNDLAIASNGNFIFDTVLASGTAYDVTVGTQPRSPAQTCTVAAGTGTVGDSNINDVRVTCSTQTFALSGSVNGLVGSGLVLQNNGADPVEVATNGSFSFPRELASGAAYNVTVRTQPSNPVQSCAVANGTGVIGTADVTNIAVTCSTSSFSVGGTVNGLAGSGLVLRNNGSDDLAVNANGAFSFNTALASGGTYNVTVASQPTNPTQVCTISNGSGTIAGTNITNVAVSCATTEVTIGGTVSGLAGSGLTLQNNGGAPFAIAANGPFMFPASVPAGSQYNVTVATQPQNPDQTCAVSGGAGTASSNVTSVSVTCTTASFSIGGTISGITGAAGIVLLQNNGADNLQLNNDGAFTFATPVPSGSTFNVTIAAQPNDRTCSIQNGTGVVGNANVTNVAVNCVSDDDDDDGDEVMR
jgi:trimeric autotransporter adhesin